MELQLLRIFKTVAEEESLTKAARRLNYVQSNISARLKQLEEELDCQLFLRSKKGMLLTQAGERLLPRASEMLKREQEIRYEIMNQDTVNELSLCVPDSFVRTYLWKPLNEWRKIHGETKVRLKTSYSHQVLDLLKNKSIDIGVVISRKKPIGLHIIQEFKSELVTVTPKNIKSISKESIKDLQPMLLGDSCFFGQAMLELNNKLGVFSQKQEYLFSIETILQCISLGIGISVFPKCLMETHPMKAHVKLHPYLGKKNFSYFKVCREDAKDSFVIKEVRTVLESVS